MGMKANSSLYFVEKNGKLIKNIHDQQKNLIWIEQNDQKDQKENVF